jgi:hypothetical protein
MADGTLHVRTASLFHPPLPAPNLREPVAVAYAEVDIDRTNRRFKGDSVEIRARDNSVIESHTLSDGWSPLVENSA